jgi:asparagine synthase (glutamine-hydrolysing)
MCGICGIIESSDHERQQESLLPRMIRVLEHRGPDDEGIYIDRPMEDPRTQAPHRGKAFHFVGLGHRRLSIIDLSPAGHQPMSNEDDTLWVVCNGEIYNFPDLREELFSLGHRFRSHSDTEVIIHGYEEWGCDCFDRLRGMFALALYDRARQRITLARDHAGIKPLYYHHAGSTFIFASEIKAIFASGLLKKTLNHEGFLQYLSLGYIPSPATIYDTVWKLPQASCLVLENDHLTIDRYWEPSGSPPPRHSPDEVATSSTVRNLLRQSVKRHLLSDVPVGVLLSGGVDSSAVVALAAETGCDSIQTFCVGFSGMGYYDERKYARIVAEKYGTDHHEIEVAPDILELLPTLIHHFDEPFADSSAVPTYYISEFCRQHVKVVLTGTGADDIFGGYKRYTIQKLIAALNCLPGFFRTYLAQISQYLPVSRKSRMLEYFLYWKKLMEAASCSGIGRYASLMYIFPPASFHALLTGMSEDFVYRCPLESNYRKHEDGDFLSRILSVDYHTYLPGDLLVKEDRMTMAVGLEGRVPYLDRDVVECATSLPSNLKVKGLTTKYIFREAVKDLLPQEIMKRPKHGFAVPIGEWFKGSLKPPIEKIMRHSPSGLFRRDYIDTMLREHTGGRADHSHRLWAWLFFEKWYEHNF